MRAGLVCLVALLGLLFTPLGVSAQGSAPCSSTSPTAICKVQVPEPETLLLLAPVAAGMLLRGKLKKKKR